MSNWEGEAPNNASSGTWEGEAPGKVNTGSWEGEAPQVAKPKRNESNWEKFSGNFAEGYDSTIVGVNDRKELSGLNQYKQVKKLKEQMQSDPKFFDKYPNFTNDTLDLLEKQAKQKMAGYKDFRMAEIKAEINDPVNAWYEEQGIGNKVHSGLTALAGNLAGGVASLSPENLLPIGKGKTLIRTFGKGALQGLPTAALQELLSQELDIELEQRENYDWAAVAKAAGVGGLVGGVFNTITNPKQIVETISEAAKKNKTLAKPEIPKAPEVNKEAVAPKQDPGFPELNQEFQVPPHMKEVLGAIEEQAGTPKLEDLNPNSTQTIRTLNAADRDFKGRAFKQELPKIKDEFKWEGEAPKAVDEPLPAIDREGFGPDVTETIRNPFIPDEQVRQANVDNMLAKDTAEAAGTHQMDIYQYGNTLDEPKGPTNAAEYLKMSQEVADGIKHDPFDYRQAFLDESMNKTRFTESPRSLSADLQSDLGISTSPREFFDGLSKTRTVKEAVGFVYNTVVDPQMKRLAKALESVLPDVEVMHLPMSKVAELLQDPNIGQGAKQTLINLHGIDFDPTTGGKTPGALGITRTAAGSGKTQVLLRGTDYLRGTGYTPETVLHEAIHTIINGAFILGDKATTAGRRYVREITNLYEQTKRQLSPELKEKFSSALENPEEFNTWAATNKDFQEALKGVNRWNPFVSSIARMFGVDTGVVKRVIDLSSEWRNIAQDPNAVGKQIKDNLIRKQVESDISSGMKKAGLDINQKQIDKMVTPFPITPEGMKASMIAEGADKDLGGKGLFSAAKQFTVNQVKAWERHPVLTHAYSAMRDIYSRAHIVFKGLDKASQPFTRASRKLQLEVAYGMTKLQTPEWQAKIAATGQKVAPDSMLRELGMSDKAIEIVKKLRPVMDDLLTFDKKSASRLGRDITTGVLDYWPISHGGQFIIELKQNGATKAIMGFDDYSTMRQMEKAIKEDPNSQGFEVTAKRRQSENGEFNDAYNEWMLGRNIPEWAQRLQYNMEKSRSARQATFELARTGVKGFIGEVMHPDTGAGRAENSRLIDVFHRRLRNSRDFYIRAEIANKVLDPMLSNPEYFNDKPNLYNFMMNWNNSLLGYDISGVKPIDAVYQTVAEGASKIPQLVKAMYHGYDARLSEPSISATAARSTAQSISLWASICTLAGNTPNIVANVLNPAMTAGWLGIPSAIKIGADPIAAVAWHGEALTRTLLGWATSDQWKFIKEMNDKGFIQPHIFEDTAVIKENRGNIVIPYKDKSYDIGNIASLINKLSNQPIEVVNNIFHLAFYKNMVDIAERQGAIDFKANPDQKWQLIVDMARDSTGDYAEYARRLVNKEMGTTGALTSNFAQWQWNQIGREMTNINRIFTETGNVGVLKAAAPTMALLTLGTLFMGLRNAPGVTDYENIRQYMSRIFPDMKLKPADQFLKDIGVGPEWRGSMLLDVIVPETLGIDPDSMPELSSGQSFASVAQAPTVVSKFILDVGTMGKFFIDAIVADKETPGVSGDTLKDEVEFINSLPKGIRPLFMKTIEREDKEYPSAVLGKYGLEYKQTPKEQVLNKWGFTSIRQGDERRDTYNDVYLAWKQNKEVQELKDSLIHSLLEGDQKRVERLYKELALKNKDALDNLVEAATKEAESRVLDRKQTLGKEFMSASKEGRQKMLAERIKNLEKP